MSFQFDHWELDDYHRKPRSPTEKTVRYSNVCSVILIPTIQEFREAGVELWDSRQSHGADASSNGKEYFCDSPIPTEDERKTVRDVERSNSKKNEEQEQTK